MQATKMVAAASNGLKATQEMVNTKLKQSRVTPKTRGDATRDRIVTMSMPLWRIKRIKRIISNRPNSAQWVTSLKPYRAYVYK